MLFSCKTTDNTKDSFKVITLKNKNNKSKIVSYKESQFKEQYKHRLLESGSISTVFLTDSDLWVGKLGGALVRYNLYTGENKTFLNDLYSIKDYSIKRIIETTESIISLQSDRVVIINKEDETLKTVFLPPYSSRASDIVHYNNKLIISTLGYGLIECDLETLLFSKIETDLKFISSLAIYLDILFIGSMNNGLYQMDIKTDQFKSRINYPLSLFKKNIVQISIIDDTLWLGTLKNGIIKWNIGSDNVKKLFPGEGVSYIYSSPNINVVSLIGYGVYIEADKEEIFKSIKSDLLTNNVTSVVVFNGKLITGNLKKGIIEQELKLSNDKKSNN